MSSSEGSHHTVLQGETLLSIARAHRFSSWEQIWEHSNNEALRDLRGDPQVLAPGDELFIPPKQSESFSVATDKRHTFVVETFKAVFRTVLLDDEGKALTNKRYELELGDELLNGETDGEGTIEVVIPPRPTKGKLVLFLDDEADTRLTWNLRLGGLDPIDTLSGVKARLTNLGFVCGAIDDSLNPETVKALRDFQIVYRLAVTGKVDDDTRAKLLSVHDKR